MYKYEVLAHSEDAESLPIACNDEVGALALVSSLRDHGYTVITVRERIGDTNQFKTIHHIDTRWMSEL